MKSFLVRSLGAALLMGGGLTGMGCQGLGSDADVLVDARVQVPLHLNLITTSTRLTGTDDLEYLDRVGCSFEVVDVPIGAQVYGGTIDWTPASNQAGYHEVVMRYSDGCTGQPGGMAEVFGIMVWDDSSSQTGLYEPPDGQVPDVHDLE